MSGHLPLGLVSGVLLASVVALMTLLAVALAPRSWRNVGPLGVLVVFTFAYGVTKIGESSGFNGWLDGVLEGIGYQLDEVSTWSPAFVGAMVALGAVSMVRRRTKSRLGDRRNDEPQSE
jgi:hypothetical protein